MAISNFVVPNGIEILGSTQSTSTSTGAFIVMGGAGISGDLYAGNIYTNGFAVSTASALTILFDGAVLGTAGTINFTTGTTATVAGGVVTVQATDSGSSTGTTSTFTISNNTPTSSTTTGALVVAGGVGINGAITLSYAQTYSAMVTTTSTITDSPVLLDSFSADQFRSGKYQIQITNENGYHACEITIVHTETAVDFSQYGEVITGSDAGTFTAALSEGNVQLLMTPLVATNTVTTIAFVRALLNNTGSSGTPPFTPDLATGSGTEDLETESGTTDLNT